MSSEISAQNTRNNVTLYLPQGTIVKYEARMSGGKARDAWHSLHRPVKRWVFPVGDGLRMELTIYARGSEKNGPLFADAYLMKDGKVRGASDYHDGLAGAFACLDYKDNDKEYTITVLPEGNYLTIKDPSQLLDPSKFFLEEDDELDVGYDNELPPLSAHVDYPLPTAFFDAGATFGVDFHTGPKGDTSWNVACEYPQPQLKACVRWLPETGKVALFIIYEGETCDELFHVALSDEENQRLRALLFTKAKEVYGKTPAEEWNEFLASQQGTI